MSQDNSSSEYFSPSTTPIPTSNVVKLYLVQAKLTAQDISQLFSLAEMHNLRVSKSRNSKSDSTKLQLCSASEDADIIITNVRMRKRLERHIDWDLAKEKAIVTPEWLRNSVQQRTILPCGDYAALRELKQTTIQSCPDSDDDTNHEEGSGVDSLASRTESKQLAEKSKAHYTSRYACLRPCPMVCPNQGLVQQLGIIRRSRELEGKDTSALSYERSISVGLSLIHSGISVPYLFTSLSPQGDCLEVGGSLKASKYRGKKLSQRYYLMMGKPSRSHQPSRQISEYVTNGKIKESQTIAASSRFKSLSEFTTIYGIGAATARKLYDSFGLRTIEDLENHYASHEPPPLSNRFPNEERQINTPAPALSIRAALALRTDLNEKIPRAEVDLMHEIVMREVERLRPGCMSTIVGGYRRGKAESKDVDIVITHPTLTSGSDQVTGIGEELVNRLYARGLITHVMHLSGFHPPDVLRTSNWDSLAKVLTVFILPPEACGAGSRRIHRRLDLIFAAPETYWTAITGWTGSKMFERDLRLWAKVERCVCSFTEVGAPGSPGARDSKQYFPRSEQEVFDILGLEWIDPTLRNADS
ncbi:DNA-directed DNA/RNA polymerase mu [Mycena sanguinolenta]|uniref:DNA-directed DNA polymerase n=1 Tax=Mycena sanguinolenta TaxID=230812 RepID=A0A8H6Y2B3_9AGAR|nr:DNA-directed DNA/RNA polymerase mu [Mycena sanguinolenta]